MQAVRIADYNGHPRRHLRALLRSAPVSAWRQPCGSRWAGGGAHNAEALNQGGRFACPSARGYGTSRPRSEGACNSSPPRSGGRLTLCHPT